MLLELLLNNNRFTHNRRNSHNTTFLLVFINPCLKSLNHMKTQYRLQETVGIYAIGD